MILIRNLDQGLNLIKNTAISKKSDDGVISEFLTSLSFFGFIANLKQFGSRSSDV